MKMRKNEKKKIIYIVIFYTFYIDFFNAVIIIRECVDKDIN